MPFCFENILQASRRVQGGKRLCFGILIRILRFGRSAPLGGRDRSETVALRIALLYGHPVISWVQLSWPLIIRLKPLKASRVNSLENQRL